MLSGEGIKQWMMLKTNNGHNYVELLFVERLEEDFR